MSCCPSGRLLGLTIQSLLVACMLAAITAPVECSYLCAGTVRKHMNCQARFRADSRPYMDCLVPYSDNSRWDKTAHSIPVPRSFAVPLPRLQAI
jgi:hypothetical protein